MKHLKKWLIIAMIASLALAITACGSKPYVCSLCTEERTSKKHTTDFYGEKMTVCDECYKEINSMFGY